jgi:iron only hydrogenase large subunit-like protein
MRVVSIMPCTAKKYEARRKEMDSAWDWWRQKDSKLAGARPFFDVDWALTTRELARMIKLAGIEIGRLPEEDFDDPLGRSTGAATIFGTTGGVMEAALRTVYEIVEKKPLENIEFAQVRGFASIKSAEVVLGGSPVRVAVAHGLSNARILLDEIRAGKSPYQFIEIMSCPGGCVGGGGQPVLSSVEKKLARSQALYTEDQVLPIRKSHENPAIQTLYKEFLGEPLGHLSHELLHTSYKARAF